MEYKILFLPENKIIKADGGATLLSAALSGGIILGADCAGRGVCGSCRVVIEAGDGGPCSEEEERLLLAAEKRDGLRLACQVKVGSDLTVRILDGEGCPPDEGGFLDPVPGHAMPDRKERGGRGYGLAVDLGTTSIIGLLWDLDRMSLEDKEKMDNPQAGYGADVISRIAYCMEEKSHIDELQRKVVGCINSMINIFCMRNRIRSIDIHKITVAGNPAMSHLFLGLDPSGLAQAPFSPAYRGSISVAAGDIGIRAHGAACVYVMPGIAGHVGGDMVCSMLAAEIFKTQGNVLVVDIGTNAEIALSSRGRITVCSAPAGPVLEGVGIQCGMKASPGAIERAAVKEDVQMQVIGGGEPRGLCGSGLIDAAAGLLRAGVMGANGNLLSPEQARERNLPQGLCRRLFRRDGCNAFVLYYNKADEDRHIVLTQRDIRQLQLAKGAILGAVRTLLKRAGLNPGDIDAVKIAGAFGNHLDKENILRIGMLPDILPEDIIFIGNGSEKGASMALFSEETRKRAEREAGRAAHLELSEDPDFQEFYIAGMMFPE